MIKYKVGDKVKIISCPLSHQNLHGIIKIGDIKTIGNIHGDPRYVLFKEHHPREYVNVNRIRLITIGPYLSNQGTEAWY